MKKRAIATVASVLTMIAAAGALATPAYAGSVCLEINGDRYCIYWY